VNSKDGPEAAELTVADIRQRDERWVIPDLYGKGGRLSMIEDGKSCPVIVRHVSLHSMMQQSGSRDILLGPAQLYEALRSRAYAAEEHAPRNFGPHVNP